LILKYIRIHIVKRVNKSASTNNFLVENSAHPFPPKKTNFSRQI